jgi:MFS transporter, DHA2 family, methylenomycin A resistance protein
MQWVVSAYTLAFAALILTAGALGDRIRFGSLIATGPFARGFRIALGISLLVLAGASLTARSIARPDRGGNRERTDERDRRAARA